MVSPARVPAGSAAKAASVGANTVKGPVPASTTSRPVVVSAPSSVVNAPVVAAVSIIDVHGGGERLRLAEAAQVKKGGFCALKI